MFDNLFDLTDPKYPQSVQYPCYHVSFHYMKQITAIKGIKGSFGRLRFDIRDLRPIFVDFGSYLTILFTRQTPKTLNLVNIHAIM